MKKEPSVYVASFIESCECPEKAMQCAKDMIKKFPTSFKTKEKMILGLLHKGILKNVVNHLNPPEIKQEKL